MGIILQMWDNFYVISLQVLIRKTKHQKVISRFTTPNGLQVFKSKRGCKNRWGNGEMQSKSHSGIFRHIYTNSGIFRHIHTYPDIIRDIQAYSVIIHVYSEACVTLADSELWYIHNPDLFKTRGKLRTLVYSKLQHIQNQRHIHIPGLFIIFGYSEPEAYSEHCQIAAMECFEKQLTAIIIFASYDYFRNISFSCPLVHAINMIFRVPV